MNAIEETLDGFDRVVEEFNLRNYCDEWIVNLVDRARFAARAKLAILEAENEGLRKELETEIAFLRTADEGIISSSIPVLNRIKKLEVILNTIDFWAKQIKEEG